ncbi:MAG: HAD family hydrolase [Myxococcales bacterium]|nr:HAD family hydrolase [Myxococcales bacterium]
MNVRLPLYSLALALALACCKKSEPPPAPPAPAVSVPGEADLPGAWEADVRQKILAVAAAALRERKAGDPAPVAVFDFDHTCVRGDLGRAFFDSMILKDRIRWGEPIFNALPEDKRADIQKAVEALSKVPPEKRAGSREQARLRKLMHKSYWGLCRSENWEQCFPWQVRFYTGYTPQEITAMAREVWAAELTRPMGSEPIREGPDDEQPAITGTGIRVYAEMRALIGTLSRYGFEVWIVTAGPQWVVRAAASDLGVPEERVLGMRTTIQDGKLTAVMEPPPTFRMGKQRAIEKFVGRKATLAFGDSWSDAEMLAGARQAVLIDRGYADLRKHAQEAGWLVQPEFPVK